MTMKTSLIKPLLLSLVASAGLALSAGAQGTAPVTTSSTLATPTTYASSYGLLGQDYAGIAFDYTELDSGPAKVMHSYAFEANRPTLANTDAQFKYEYSTVSALGARGTEHDISFGGTRYFGLKHFKPYIKGDLGWAFASTENTGVDADSDSFFYLIEIGAEFQALSRLALTPYVNYSEATHFNTRGWVYGGKATYRFAQQWSGSLKFEVTDENDLRFGVGINHHF